VKITVINGCNDDNLLQAEVVKKISEYIDKSETGTTINWIDLSKNKLKYCLGCDSCQTINPGVCAINDGLNEILVKYLYSDTVIIVTPIQFGCCNSVIKNFIDRTEPLFLPYQVLKDGKSIMKGRYDRYPELLFIGVTSNGNLDSIETFKNFVQKCNLSAASKKVSVKIITEKADLDSLKVLVL
jgi:multimeric flavodoxin WrbA